MTIFAPIAANGGGPLGAGVAPPDGADPVTPRRPKRSVERALKPRKLEPMKGLEKFEEAAEKPEPEEMPAWIEFVPKAEGALVAAAPDDEEEPAAAGDGEAGADRTARPS